MQETILRLGKATRPLLSLAAHGSLLGTLGLLAFAAFLAYGRWALSSF